MLRNMFPIYIFWFLVQIIAVFVKFPFFYCVYFIVLCVTEFAAGAMENWGLVTYREVELMIDESKASSQQKQVPI